MKHNSLRLILALILLSFFARGVFLVGVFPIFKGQDESRHYNTVQYLSTGQNKDCQNETYEKDGRQAFVKSEQVKQDLSTYRYSDEIKETSLVVQHKQIRGEYYDKVNFIDGKDGLGEEEFKNVQHSKVQHVCPPDVATSSFGKKRFSLYQWGASVVERLLSSQDIFVRYSALRIISVLLGMIMLWMAYNIFRVVRFSEKQSLILIAIISFQPKLVTYFTNINYDVLLITLWTGFILIGSIVLKKGWSFGRGLLLILLLVGAIVTKPSALPLLGLALFLVGKTFYREFKEQKINWVVIALIVLVGGGISCLLFDKVGLTSLFSERYLSVLGEYLSKSLPKIYGSSRDYWGAIGWSANNLTLVYVKAIWVIEWIAWLGLGIWIVGPWVEKVVGNFAKVGPLQSYKDWTFVRTFVRFSAELKKQKKYFWFMIISVIVLQLGIRVADWRVFTGSGSLALGTPGRYWLPNVVPHFVLLAIGLKVIVGFARSKVLRERYFELSLLGFLVLMILYWCYEAVNIIIPRFYL